MLVPENQWIKNFPVPVLKSQSIYLFCRLLSICSMTFDNYTDNQRSNIYVTLKSSAVLSQCRLRQQVLSKRTHQVTYWIKINEPFSVIDVHTVLLGLGNSFNTEK